MGRQLVDGRCRVRQDLGHKFIQTQLLHPHTERLGVQQRVCNLRPVGVGRAGQGQGWGRGLMEFSLARLAAWGVRGCVIDWTTLLDFYAKFGFRPLRGYRVLVKELPGTTP